MIAGGIEPATFGVSLLSERLTRITIGAMEIRNCTDAISKWPLKLDTTTG